jgi:hypothetical protein
MKQGLTLLAILAILLGAGCQAASPVPPSPPPSEPPPQSFFLEVTEPQDETVVSASPIRVSGSTSPEAQVSMNGQLIDVDGQGNFAAMVELEEGPNVIEVIATDYEGNEESCILAVIYAP